MTGRDQDSRRRSHWLVRLLGISGWVLAIGTFLLCIPTPFGPAKLGFTIVSGHSMEPTYWTNDIVVTWRTSDYAVGEPVVYTIPGDEPGAGFNVVHRIVGVRTDGTFETLGDNNAMPDMWQPGTDDVKGRVFFKIPKLGVVFHPGILPLALAAIAGLFVSMSVWNWLDDGEKDGDGDPPSGSGPPRASRRHLGHLNAVAFRVRLGRTVLGALRITRPRHARRQPAWRRRTALAFTFVVFVGTASASHAATLGGVRAADLFVMTTDTTPVTPPPVSGDGLGLAAIVQGGAGPLDVTFDVIGGNVVIHADDSAGGACNPSHITGDLILYKSSGSLPGRPVTLSNCDIDGSVFAYGDVDVANPTHVGGDVVSTNGSLTISGKVGGKAVAAGSITMGNPGKVSGLDDCTAPTCEPHASSTPAVLPRSAWYDYRTSAAGWQDAGYQLRRLGPGGNLVPGDTGCSLKGDQALLDAVSALQKKTVIDATKCDSLDLAGSVALQTDVTFITGRFTSPDNSLTVRSQDGADHQFNVIRPEPSTGPANSPDCATPSADPDSMTGWETPDGHISGLVYTPCPLMIGNANLNWRGQVFAGIIRGQGSSATVTYAPINGLPGGARTGGFGA